MSTLTFDWAQIAYNLSPLASPWWAQANVISGFGMSITNPSPSPRRILILFASRLLLDPHPCSLLHEHLVCAVPPHPVLACLRQHRCPLQRHPHPYRPKHPRPVPLRSLLTSLPPHHIRSLLRFVVRLCPFYHLACLPLLPQADLGPEQTFAFRDA